MMREPVKFALPDYNLEGHEYEQPWFPPDHAMALVMRLVGLLGGLDDLSKIGVSSIVGKDGLLDMVFRGCRRDGKLVDSSAGRIDAYTGNLGEMVDAIKAIVEAQILPFVPEKLLKELQGSMQSEE